LPVWFSENAKNGIVYTSETHNVKTKNVTIHAA
jgi:hypothetical protein